MLTDQIFTDFLNIGRKYHSFKGIVKPEKRGVDSGMNRLSQTRLQSLMFFYVIFKGGKGGVYLEVAHLSKMKNSVAIGILLLFFDI